MEGGAYSMCSLSRDDKHSRVERQRQQWREDNNKRHDATMHGGESFVDNDDTK